MAYTFNQNNIVTFDSKGNTLLPNGLTVLGLASAGFVKTDSSGRFFIDTGGAVGQTTNSITFNNSGTGSASGASFNGASAVTISYNTIGAQPLATNLTSLASLTYTTPAFVKMTGAGVFVLDTSGGTQTLQQVTTAGNDTTNTIILKNPTDQTKFFEIRVLSNGNLLFDSSGTASLHCTGDIVAFSDGTGGGTGSPGSYGAGHVIARQLVPYTQREVLSFSTIFSVTDDPVNNATLIGFDTASLSIPIAQLTGLNLQAVTDGGNTTNDAIILQSPDLSKQFTIQVLNNGNILFSALGGSSLHCTGDIVAFSDGTGGGTGTGAGYGAGHVIARLLVPYTQRETLSFSGVFTVTDDAANNATLVDFNTAGLSIPTTQLTGLNLQAVTDGGNVTNDPIILTNTAGTSQVSISVDSNGNVILTAGTNKNFHFSGDVIAFSSLTPPAGTWWDSLPIATASTLGGIKIGSGLSIDGSGVLSVTGGESAIWGNITGTLSNQTDLWNALSGKASSVHTHVISDITGLQTALDGKEPTLTKGNLTELTSSVLTITGGTNAVIGSGTSIQVKQASGSQSGFLSSTDWTTFNNKQNALTNPVTGTGNSGYIAYWNSLSSITGESALYWDATNDRLDVTGTVRIVNGANTVTVSVDANGNVIFTAGTNKNFHFSGDVVAFSSMTPPDVSWWASLPYATTTTVGGVKIDGTTIVIDGSGVISAVGGGGGSVNLYTDYDNTITGSRNSVNTVFQTSFNFVSGSTRVFVNGLRYSKGASYDYQETAANQITFTTAPDSGDLIVIDYIKV